ncbi:MAG: thermonuclease family protein [Magnetococcales bacterium]|nr:thermonuclease family protein [Magnetococcales bacterium]
MTHHICNPPLFAKVCRFFFALCGNLLVIGGPFLPNPGWAESWMGRVERVVDGDSLVVVRDGERVKVRLSGVDTPEHGQPFAEQARGFARARVEGRTVRVVEKETDRHGRMVAWVTRPGEEELGAALVRAGLAWRHAYFSNDAGLKALEKSARERRLGLWSHADPTPPWVWKRRQKRE